MSDDSPSAFENLHADSLSAFNRRQDVLPLSQAFNRQRPGPLVVASAALMRPGRDSYTISEAVMENCGARFY